MDITQVDLAELLNTKGRRNHNGELIKKYTKHIVKNIEGSRNPYTYLDLECYSRIIKIPSGLLLLISRIQHDSSEDVLNIANAVRDVVGKTAESNGTITYRHLSKLSEYLDYKNGDEKNSFHQNSKSTIERYKILKEEQEADGIDPLVGLELWDR